MKPQRIISQETDKTQHLINESRTYELNCIQSIVESAVFFIMADKNLVVEDNQMNKSKEKILTCSKR